MKIVCIGGGPGGLYFSILMKKAFPAADIQVHERLARGETFGWGVVFSDETMAGFREDDPEVVDAITDAFAYWRDIDTYRGGIGAEELDHVTSTGHGFCGMSRIKLLELLEDRALELGVTVHHNSDIDDPAQLGDVDLIVAGDGINSATRTRLAAYFEPSLDGRPNHFCWLGTDRPLSSFTFLFKENEHGLFCVHAYPYQPGTSTWIVECQAETFERAGFADMGEDETVAYMQELFKQDLEHDGQQYSILGNKSIWRQFPIVRNKRWHHENIVLIGDAAHTAHFSIGSGTKLAMEDAAALAAVFREHGDFTADEVPGLLGRYQQSRDEIAGRLQTTAGTSLKWFEVMDRYMAQDADTFSFNLMTRSKSITYGNLMMRDPALVGRLRDAHATRAFAAAGLEPTLTKDGELPPPAFTPLKLGGRGAELVLANRIVVSPMCQYSATEGVPNDWHLVHLGGRAIGGAGLVIAEATSVSPEGPITPGCTGIWNDAQRDAWKRVVDFVHAHSAAKIGLQIGHAGRKASTDVPWKGGKPLAGAAAWLTIGPSAEPFDTGWHTPKAMERADMERVTADFVAAAERAAVAGFDLLELHMAHGYLLSSFLSPASNHRTDAYGGSLENRLRWPLEVLAAVRAVWQGPLAVRISATDWLKEGGLTGADAVELSKAFEAGGADLIDVSTGGVVPRADIQFGRMYQVPFAERIKREVGIPVMAVGAIQHVDHVDTIVAAGRADLCAMARPHLVDPYLTLEAAGAAGLQPDVPPQYLAGRNLLVPRD